MKLLMVSFSDNTDHQNTLYSMAMVLKDKLDIYTLGIKNPKVRYDFTPKNYMVNCPKRPGITLNTFDIVELKHIANIIQNGNFDYIYFESLHMWNIFIMLLYPNIKYVHAIHDIIPHDGNVKKILIKAMNKAIARLANRIVLRNKEYIYYFSEVFHVEKNRISFINVWRQYPGYKETNDTKKVLFFGRINQYKGVDNILALIRLLPDVQFELVGKVAADQANKVNRLKSMANVHVIDRFVEEAEMQDCFYNADCVIIPYHTATQSGVIIDSYKFSRPVVAFNVGAIKEQVVHGKTGYLIEAGNINDFSRKIRNIIERSKADKNTLNTNAFNYGYQEYSANTSQDKFLELFNF